MRRRLQAYLSGGLVGGLGIALSLGLCAAPVVAGPQPDCPEEGECNFRKPTVAILIDYSSSMNAVWDQEAQTTRWEVIVEGLAQIVQPGSFLSQNTLIALLRYGHDPDPDTPGTPIPGDNSGLVDGVALDVDFDDDNFEWLSCNGGTVVDTLGSLPSPLDGAPNGIGAWTRGGLEAVAELITTTRADHPEDMGERLGFVLLLTDSPWTGPTGVDAPPEHDPTPVAAALFEDQGVPTYVVRIADGPPLETANAIAAAGGTVEALDAPEPEQLLESSLPAAIDGMVEAVQDSLDNCPEGLPRTMILLDASSSMLNVNGDSEAGAMGETNWDMVRSVLGEGQSIWQAQVNGVQVEDFIRMGLAVYGDDLPEPGEQQVLNQYSDCADEYFDWSLDPWVTCRSPGCEDPWGGPPIVRTYPEPGQCYGGEVLHHMPRCEGEPGGPCTGSGAFLHLGLEAVAANQAAYHAENLGEDGLSELTAYTNVVITGGRYSTYSTDAQVQAPLVAMHAAGITTHIIAIGDAAQDPEVLAELDQAAQWGSGGLGSVRTASTEAELEAELLAVIGEPSDDPCCAVGGCPIDEPTTAEPDPVCVSSGPVDDPDDPEESGDGDGDPGPGDGDGEDPAEGSDGSETGTETGDASDTDASGSTGTGDGGAAETGTGSDPGLDLEGRGCSCASDEPQSPFAPFVFGLLVLASVRRRVATPVSSSTRAH